jgi:hypothetical protein
VPAGGSHALEFELDALGVGGVAGGVLALHFRVLAQLVALVAIASSELLGLSCELLAARGLISRGVEVMGVFPLEP